MALNMPKSGIQKKNIKYRYIPYANGFLLPTKEQQKSAVGYNGFVPPEFSIQPAQDGYEFFKQIPKPTSIDDWLAQYVAKGQTFQEYLSECPWFSFRQVSPTDQKFIPTGKNIREKYPEGRIYLLPIGSFNDKRFVHFDELARFAEIYLGIPVHTLPGVELDLRFKEKQVYWVNDSKISKDYNCEKSYHELQGRFYNKHHRYQVGVSSLLIMIKKCIPEDALCVIGLTMSDLYKEESDLFVAGWAAGRSNVAVFSFFRYDPSLKISPADWYSMRRDHRMSQKHIQNIIFHRSCKLLVHEIGHLLGIAHCIFFECCMNGSGHLAEDFRQPMHFCPVDLHKLQALVGFDILSRYQSLFEFYRKHGMKKEAEWISKRIEFIKKSPIEII